MRRAHQILNAFLILCFVGGITIWLLGKYRSHRLESCTAKLPLCDRVELSLLYIPNRAKPPAVQPVATSTATRVPSFGRHITVLDAKVLSGTEAESFGQLWRAQTIAPGMKVWGHRADYGLRFYSGSKLTFETTLCFGCANFRFNHLTGPDYVMFDIWEPAGRELLQRLQSVFSTSIAAAK